MSDYEKLKNRLQKTPFLTTDADSDKCALIGSAAATRMKMDSEFAPFPSIVLMNLAECLKAFSVRAGTADRVFTTADLTKIAHQPYSTIRHWLDEGILVPSIRDADHKERLFSYADAFAAGVLGSLRRQGQWLPMMRKVSSLLAERELSAV